MSQALISTGSRDDDEEARLYGQRLKAGVRALTSVSQAHDLSVSRPVVSTAGVLPFVVFL